MSQNKALSYEDFCLDFPDEVPEEVCKAQYQKYLTDFRRELGDGRND